MLPTTDEVDRDNTYYKIDCTLPSFYSLQTLSLPAEGGRYDTHDLER